MIIGTFEFTVTYVLLGMLLQLSPSLTVRCGQIRNNVSVWFLSMLVIAEVSELPDLDLLDDVRTLSIDKP